MAYEINKDLHPLEGRSDKIAASMGSYRQADGR